MPGVLKRAETSSDLKPSKSRAEVNCGTMAEGSLKKDGSDGRLSGMAHVNGTGTLTNGLHAKGLITDHPSSTEPGAAAAEKMYNQMPPEIEHITQGYQPLSRLMIRLAQETFNGLGEVITEMADMQALQSNHASSYLNGAGASHASPANVQKKERLWNFCQDRRAKFIKLLVLSQWSRQAEAVGNVIDVNLWQVGQKRLYDDATLWMGELKRQLCAAKMPSADLKVAVEALSTGKASWLPDLGYLPPEPLSVQQLLKALRTINTLLSVRLNLHEDIPPRLRNFSIASGRVAFRVHEEFEVELSIADEDPSSQLYFIDFRFLFSPSLAEIPQGRLRDEIEGKTNDVLRREGLTGCFDFLHDLVLTHKISILRQQAFDLVRGRWSENLRVEVLHRSLVLQYWLNRPGGKNWIEIGIKGGRQKKKISQSEGEATPYISLRWHRHGKEVLDPEIKMDLGNLSIEVILRQIIAAHTNHILKETKKKIRAGVIYAKKVLFVKHRASKKEPADCSLRIQLTTSSIVTVAQEPISGAFAILPPSNLHVRLERELNILKDPATEASSRIVHLRCTTAQDQIDARAKVIGWEQVRTLSPTQETVRRMFSPDVMRLSFYRIKSWDNRWMIASTTSMVGDMWWVVRLHDESTPVRIAEPEFSHDQTFKATFKLPFSKSVVIEPSYLLLGQVENAAAAMVSQSTDVQYLNDFRVPWKQQQSSKPQALIRIPDLYMRFSQHVVPPIIQTPRDSKKAWCHEMIRHSFAGLARSRKSVIHVVTARLLTPIPNIQNLTSTIDSSIAFHPTSGSFAFRLLTPIGTPSIPPILERLQRIERLVRFLTTIQQNKLQCEAVTLSRLLFIYDSSIPSHPLRADVRFATDSPMQIFFNKDNPHLRIQDLLTTALNSNSGLQSVAVLLRATLPLLRAFAAIESPPQHLDANDNVRILPRSAVWYRIAYERPQALFEIRLRQRLDRVVWFTLAVEARGVDKKEDVSSTVMEAWQKLRQDGGQGWRGMKDGIVAGPENVESLILRIDEMIRGLKVGKSIETDGKAEEGVTVKSEPDREIVVLD